MDAHTCQICDGTKQLVLMKTWFLADGFNKVKCTVCDGTGEHPHLAHLNEWAAEQAQLRVHAQERQGK